MSTTPRNPFWPDVSKEAGPKTHFALTIAQNAIQEHDRAITELKSQVDTLSSQVSSSSSTASATTTATTAASATAVRRLSDTNVEARLLALETSVREIRHRLSMDGE